MLKLAKYLNILDIKLVIIAQIFKRLFYSMPKHQQVTDETSQFMLKEMFSLVCRIRFRQASNADIQEAVELLHDIEEKFPNGTYHPDFEYRKVSYFKLQLRCNSRRYHQKYKKDQDL